MGFDLNQVVVFYVTVPAILKLPMTGFEPRISGVGSNYFGKCAITTYFFIKMGNPRTLFRLFLVLFKQTIQFLQQINVKMSCPSNIRRRDSNPRPLKLTLF